MNAKEFIQKFGWNDARVCILNCACPEDRWFMRRGDLVSDQDFDDLKRLVESYELVEKYKKGRGIRFRIRWGQFRYGDTKEYNDRLKQAIADVESCMEAS